MLAIECPKSMNAQSSKDSYAVMSSINSLCQKLSEENQAIVQTSCVKTESYIPMFVNMQKAVSETGTSNQDVHTQDEGSLSKDSFELKTMFSHETKNANMPAMNSSSSKCSFAPRQKKINTACPHKDKKHYAKNMCSACYHRIGRTKMSWKCQHKSRAHYARGLCQNCYLSLYHQNKGFAKKRNTAGKKASQDSLAF